MMTSLIFNLLKNNREEGPAVVGVELKTVRFRSDGTKNESKKINYQHLNEQKECLRI
jgi:hypothetical protein